MTRHWPAVTVLALVAGVAVSSAPALSPESSSAARAKIERISSESMKPGEKIILTEDEINSYLKYDYASEMPQGVRDLRIKLLKGRGVVHAYVDLGKLQSNSEGSFAALWLAVFRGERQLEATCRYTSAGGKATVELESAQLDGTNIPKPILDWLVSWALAEHFSNVEMGKPSPLPHNLEQIRVEPGQAVITSY
jgi:hypothetical protein